MKNYIALLVVAFVSFLAGTLILPVPAQKQEEQCVFAKVEKGKKDVILGDVECDRLTIKSKCGKHILSMVSFNEGVGIWMSRGKEHVVMASMFDQPPYIGLMHYDSKIGCPLALCWKDNKPFVQLMNDKEFVAVDVDQLLKLLKPKK